jgi:fatty acid desaturase
MIESDACNTDDHPIWMIIRITACGDLIESEGTLELSHRGKNRQNLPIKRFGAQVLEHRFWSTMAYPKSQVQDVENLELREDNYSREVSDRLPSATLRDLSQINTGKATLAIIAEWTAILSVGAICHTFWNPFLYIFAVAFIGARQHALAVLNHDAAHYRLFPKRWNDAIAEPLLAWPILLSTRWFRSYHYPHHRHLGTEADSNRRIYHTHTTDGTLAKTWTFPKHPLLLLGLLGFDLLGIPGVAYVFQVSYRIWMVKSPLFTTLQGVYYGSAIALTIYFHLESILFLYWLVPLCTWFVATNHLRIIAEHSAISSSHLAYSLSRTTIPSWLDSLFLVPRNISYHIEHHFYPSVPFYRLPDLHHALMKQTGFRDRAHLTKTYWGVLQELVQPRPELEH